MVSFKNVNTKDYGKIKRGLKKLVKITPCPSDDKSIIETFDIVSLSFKFPVTYYKTKTLLVNGDESNQDYKRAIEFIQSSRKIHS
jgi:hypothetical protein